MAPVERIVSALLGLLYLGFLIAATVAIVKIFQISRDVAQIKRIVQQQSDNSSS